MTDATIELPTPLDLDRLRWALDHAETMAETVTLEVSLMPRAVVLHLDGLRPATPVSPIEVVDAAVSAGPEPAVLDIDAGRAAQRSDPGPEPSDEGTKPETAQVTHPRRGPDRHGKGTAAWDLLTAVADQGGTWEGTLGSLGDSVERGTHAANLQKLRQLVKAGLLTVDRVNHRKVRSASITRAGWDHLGRLPTNPINADLVLNEAAPDPDRPPADFSAPPMGRNGRPDGDAARARAAEAAW